MRRMSAAPSMSSSANCASRLAPLPSSTVRSHSETGSIVHVDGIPVSQLATACNKAPVTVQPAQGIQAAGLGRLLKDAQGPSPLHHRQSSKSRGWTCPTRTPHCSPSTESECRAPCHPRATQEAHPRRRDGQEAPPSRAEASPAPSRRKPRPLSSATHPRAQGLHRSAPPYQRGRRGAGRNRVRRAARPALSLPPWFLFRPASTTGLALTSIMQSWQKDCE